MASKKVKKAKSAATKKAVRKGKKKAAKKAAKKAPSPRAGAHTVALKPTTTRRATEKSTGRNRVEAYKGPNLTHHPVSGRRMDEVARDGLRSDGEILQGEEAGVAPCRLVDHGEGRFSLCFDDFRMPKLSIFDERGLQGGGYTWEAVVDSLLRLRRPELVPQVSYDSEAGMFVAIGSRSALRDVAALIQEAIENPQTLREALDRADPDRLE